MIQISTFVSLLITA